MPVRPFPPSLAHLPGSRTREADACLHTLVSWFTSLLGKFSSVPPVVGALREAGIANYVVHESIQGQTRRWVVGWSFENTFARDVRSLFSSSLSCGRLEADALLIRRTLLTQSIGRSPSKPLHAFLPPSNTRSFDFPPAPSLDPSDIWAVVLPLLADLKGVSVVPFPPTSTAPEGGYVIRTTAHSWSRAARRKGKTAAGAPEGDAGQGAAPAAEFFSCVLELAPSGPTLIASSVVPCASSPTDRPPAPLPPALTLSTHFLSCAPGTDVSARRLAWDGLWLSLVRKVKDSLLASVVPAAGEGERQDAEMT